MTIQVFLVYRDNHSQTQPKELICIFNDRNIAINFINIHDNSEDFSIVEYRTVDSRA